MLAALPPCFFGRKCARCVNQMVFKRAIAHAAQGAARRGCYEIAEASDAPESTLMATAGREERASARRYRAVARREGRRSAAALPSNHRQGCSACVRGAQRPSRRGHHRNRRRRAPACACIAWQVSELALKRRAVLEPATLVSAPTSGATAAPPGRGAFSGAEYVHIDTKATRRFAPGCGRRCGAQPRYSIAQHFSSLRISLEEPETRPKPLIAVMSMQRWYVWLS
jgi:hypothetical protein